MGLFSWFHIWIVHYSCVDLTLITLIILYLPEEVKREQVYPKPALKELRRHISVSGDSWHKHFNGRRKWSSEGQCSGSPRLTDRMSVMTCVIPRWLLFPLMESEEVGENFNGTQLQNCWNCLQILYVSFNIFYKRSFTSSFLCVTSITFSCLIALAVNSSMALNRNGKSGFPYFIPGIGVECPAFYHEV